jgi:hypothetical protein
LTVVNQRPSRRFNANRWTSRLVPALLILLALALLVTLVIIFLSIAGATPGF